MIPGVMLCKTRSVKGWFDVLRAYYELFGAETPRGLFFVHDGWVWLIRSARP